MDLPPKTLGERVRRIEEAAKLEHPANSDTPAPVASQPESALSDGVRTAVPPAAEDTAGWVPETSLAKRFTTEVAASQDSLPVLEALQEFLDSEREVLQTRIRALTWWFAGIVAAILLVGSLVAMAGHRYFTREVSSIRGQVKSEDEDARAVRHAAWEAVAQAEKRAADMRTDFEKERAAIDKALGDVDSKFVEYTAEQAEEMKALRQVIARIRKDAEKIQADRVRARTAPRTAPRKLRGTARDLILAIKPPGATEPVPWRLSIPE